MMESYAGFLDANGDKRIFLPEIAGWMMAVARKHQEWSRNSSLAEFDSYGLLVVHVLILYFTNVRSEWTLGRLSRGSRETAFVSHGVRDLLECRRQQERDSRA